MSELVIINMNDKQDFNFNNRKLTRVSKRIASAGNRMKEDMYKIAVALAEVKNEKLYEDDDFKNVSDYAEQVFGFKKTLTYNLIKVGERFTVKIGKSHYGSKYADDNGDYSTQQLSILSPLDDEQIDELVENNTINYDMTINDLRGVVKTIRADECEETEIEEVDDIENDEEVKDDEREAIKEVLLKLDFLKGRGYPVDNLMSGVREMIDMR